MINPKKNNPFQDFVGIHLEENTKEGCLLSLKLEESHFNLYGIPHGGVHSTLLDIAMGIAGSYSSSKKEIISTITLNLNINFIMETKDKKLFAKGLIRRRTRKLAFCEGVVHDSKSNALATSSGVFKLIRE